MEKIYNKLVRDNIPEIIEKDGEIPIVRVLGDYEFRIELERKLQEEYIEFLTAKDKANRLEEIADMFEVLSDLIQLEDSDLPSVLSIMDKKREKRGGFSKRLFLEKTIK